ncbi:MAG: hypothetical protein LBR57_03385 [Alistipes sp.]|jgi:uncharacterized protein (TIGR02145 family)|nr:hypothetical protein [Alistipes sp.]
MTLEVGTWGDQVTASNYASVMAFFKFGGVVGFDLTGNFTSGQMTAVKFNPTNTTWTSYGDNTTSGTGIIPGYTYSSSILDVSASTYHNSTNVPLGKGDPCRLVGLTVAQIKAGSIDSGQYRLPTLSENQAFLGSTSNQSAGSAYYTVSGGWSSSDPGIGTFPAGNSPGTLLPAAGFRSSISGSAGFQGTDGYYWSSTVRDSTYGYILFFISSIVSTSNNSYDSYAEGYAVRCVRQ